MLFFPVVEQLYVDKASVVVKKNCSQMGVVIDISNYCNHGNTFFLLFSPFFLYRIGSAANRFQGFGSHLGP